MKAGKKVKSKSKQKNARRIVLSIMRRRRGRNMLAVMLWDMEKFRAPPRHEGLE